MDGNWLVVSWAVVATIHAIRAHRKMRRLQAKLRLYRAANGDGYVVEEP